MGLNPKLRYKSPPTPTNDPGRRRIESGPSRHPDQQVKYTIHEADEIDTILRDFGHWVFLRRATNKKCACFSLSLNEADPHCPHCTGTGWAYRDLKVKSRRVPVGDPVTRATAKQVTDVGIWAASHYIFYLPKTAVIGETEDCTDYDERRIVTLNPSDRDSILEMQLNPDTREMVIPHNIEAVWSISMAHPYRGENGDTMYWACAVVEKVLGK